MKIGLLTLMNIFNYGGMLQCLSLCRTLERLGYEVSVFDYTQFPKRRLARRWMYYTGSRIGSIIEQKIGERMYGTELFRKFNDFKNKRLNLTRPCNSDTELRKLSRDFNILMVGSDQVWNLDWFTPAYFLNFAWDFSGQKVSYAACFGHAVSHMGYEKEVKTWLKQFDQITVRNTMSQALVKKLCDRDSQIVTDPTLLYDLDEIAIMPELPHSRFILLYALSQKRFEDIWPVLTQLRDRLGLPIVAIKSYVLQPWAMPEVECFVHDPTIEEWLGLFCHASFIVTDSFHGTLYAVKNHIPFFNYIGSGKGMERIEYVVERYGLHAGCSTDLNVVLKKDLDYMKIGREVEAHRTDSLAFLESLQF